MTNTNTLSILDYFTPEMHQDGGVRMFECQKENQGRLYILNGMGRKLLQLCVKNEPLSDKKNSASFAQIKIIPYGLRNALIWGNDADDPRKIRLSNLFDYELTYHGAGNFSQAPKIHIIEKKNGQKIYKTLVDFTLPLSDQIFRFVPIFSLMPGYASATLEDDAVKKKAHVFRMGSCRPVQLDFYISGAEADFNLAFNTNHGLSMFYSLDYLCAKKKRVLSPVTISMPITGHRMGEYMIWVRSSLSTYSGRPMMQFYQNADYYESFSSRRIAWMGEDGGLVWSTGAAEDAKIMTEIGKNASQK